MDRIAHPAGRGHWERRHKFSDFGCTVCHDGQGRGLENYYSHGEDPFWPDPLLGLAEELEERLLELARTQNVSSNGGTYIHATFLRVTVGL